MILGLNLATSFPSCVIIQDGKLVLDRFFDLKPEKGGVNNLNHYMRSIFQEFDKKEIKEILCCVGPGGFTGIRAGLSYAQGLSLGFGIPLRGFNSFDIYEHQAEDEIICIDSKRMELFFKVKNDYKILTIEEFSHFYQGEVVGDFAFDLEKKYNNLIYKELNHSIAPLMLAYAKGEFILAGNDKKYPEPFYMREADISQTKQQNRRIEGDLI